MANQDMSGTDSYNQDMSGTDSYNQDMPGTDSYNQDMSDTDSYNQDMPDTSLADPHLLPVQSDTLPHPPAINQTSCHLTGQKWSITAHQSVY